MGEDLHAWTARSTGIVRSEQCWLCPKHLMISVTAVLHRLRELQTRWRGTADRRLRSAERKGGGASRRKMAAAGSRLFSR